MLSRQQARPREGAVPPRPLSPHPTHPPAAPPLFAAMLSRQQARPREWSVPPRLLSPQLLQSLAAPAVVPLVVTEFGGPNPAYRLSLRTTLGPTNCSSSVEPLSATVDACPPVIVICRASKYPAPKKL